MVVLMLCYFIRIMDPTLSLGRTCLGENVYGSSSEKVKGHGDWDALEYINTTSSKEKKVTKALSFYKMETDEDPFEDEYEKTEKSMDDWDQLLDFNFDDIPQLDGEELPLFVCKIEKSSRNKKRAIENLNLFYPDIRPSSSTGRHLTQEDAAKEALAHKISQKFALLEEVRPVLETMAYHDKYKKVLDEICEALKEKDDPEAFIFPIRLEGKVNKNALADTGSDINTMSYWIYEQLGREEIKKVNRGITMINHAQSEAMGILTNVLLVGRGFLCTIVGIVNTPERLFSTFDGICHKTFRAARSDVLRTAESDSDDEEDMKLRETTERLLALQAVINPFRKISVWKKAVSFLGSLPVPLQHVNWKPDYKGCYTNEEEAKGQWRTEIRVTNPYGNIYVQAFTTKKTYQNLSKYHKLSDIMSPNWFIE
ncbi:hypothetical protein Tco_1493290 [Tanacetum coccineum]